MTTEQKLSNYVTSVVALIRGEDAIVTAKAIERQADSAIKTHIACLTGDIVSLEDAVTTAKENAKIALANNGVRIEKRDVYVENLLMAENAISLAVAALDEAKFKIEFLERKLAELHV